MLKLHFLLAWRNIVKRRFYSLIEIVGLSVGLTCFFIILLYVRKELSFDSNFTGYEKEVFFQDHYFDSLYKQEQQVAKITVWFSGLAILLASLGLLGMSSFVILKRTKEIGIRKVVGAAVPDILILLSGNFLKLIAIAFIISIPITIHLSQLWLEDFVVRIPITPQFFMIAGLVTLGVALLTIGYQSIKAAVANPVDAIKQE